DSNNNILTPQYSDNYTDIDNSFSSSDLIITPTPITPTSNNQEEIYVNNTQLSNTDPASQYETVAFFNPHLYEIYSSLSNVCNTSNNLASKSSDNPQQNYFDFVQGGLFQSQLNDQTLLYPNDIYFSMYPELCYIPFEDNCQLQPNNTNTTTTESLPSQFL
ncbi:688_t:CDS:1, partial [Ambispora gerdemannii]